MIVITLVNCPPSLRGDLTKWLQEISTGVYAGQIGAGVRDALWDRVCQNAGDGRATMVYSTNNEQRIGFKVHQCEWEPIDFDGIKLMMRPSKPKGTGAVQRLERHSNAYNYHTARQMTSAMQNKNMYPRDYCTIDIETTGINRQQDEIVEIGAIRVRGGREVEKFSTLVKCNRVLPRSISVLTGITNAMLDKTGQELKEAIKSFLTFIDNDSLICHNATFDIAFLQRACTQTGQENLDNKCLDTYVLARRYIEDDIEFKLESLANYFGVKVEGHHRALEDSRTTYKVYEKLIEKVLKEK